MSRVKMVAPSPSHSGSGLNLQWRLVLAAVMISSIMAWLSIRGIKFPTALLGAVLFLGLSYFRLFWALTLMMVYIPFQQALPQINLGTGINIFNGLLLALILGWGLSSYREKRPLIYGLKVNRPILALVVATLASWFFGIMHPGGFSHGLGRFVEVYQWLGVMALFYITISTVRTEKQVKFLLAVMGLVTAVMAIDLIRTHNLLLVTGYSHNLRMGGVFGVGGENDLGAFLAEFSLVLLTLLAISRRFIVKIYYASIFLVVGLALLYTYSRGAYLGAMAGLLFYAYSKDRRLMIVVAAVLVTLPVWAPASVMDRISMTFTDGAMESSASSRFDFWKAGLQMMLQSPIFGVGFHRFAEELPRYISDLGSARTAHNMYVSIGAELGIPGLVAFAWLLSTLFKEGWQVFRESTSSFSRQVARGYLATLVALLVINMFGVRFERVELTGLFWLYSALVVRLNMDRMIIASDQPA